MDRSEHDPTVDEGTHIADGSTLDDPTHLEEVAPRTERMAAPEVVRPAWNKTVPIAGDAALKELVRTAGDALAKLPVEVPQPSQEEPSARDTQVSRGQRRAEPEPPTMRRPPRRRRGPYLFGAGLCILGGGVVAALWPSDGTAPPSSEPAARVVTSTTVTAPPATSAAPMAPPIPTLPLVEGAGTGDGSDLAPYQGYLVVRSTARAQLFEGQTARGPTNRKLVLRCRDYTLRLRDPHTQRWLSGPTTVSVACQKVTTVVVAPDPR